MLRANDTVVFSCVSHARAAELFAEHRQTLKVGGVAVELTESQNGDTRLWLRLQQQTIKPFPASDRLRVVGIYDLDPGKRITAGFGLDR